MDGPPRPADRPPPGVRLGLPAEGNGSLASGGRRLLALAIDWACAMLVSNAFFGGDPWATLAVFAVVQVLALVVAGGSPGHRLLGLRVAGLVSGRRPGTVSPRGVGLRAALVRVLLLSLVVPALIHDKDGRGLHDRAARTVLVRV